MAKAEKRRKPSRLPKQIETAIDAAEDKKALDLAVAFDSDRLGEEIENDAP